MRKIKQGTAKNVMVLMVDAADHVAGKTGLTLTITASKDGAAFASISPTVTERGSGWYAVALTAGHTDTLGDLALHITGAAADPADMVLLVEARSVDDVLPTASYTAPDNAAIASINGRLPADPADQSAVDASIAGIPVAPSAGDNAAAVLVAAAANPLAVNVKEVNDEAIIGDGTAGSMFRSHLRP